MNVGNVLSIAQMALNAAPSEVALVHGLIQSKKTGGTVGLLGSILSALPEEIELVSTIIAAIHANNQTAAVAPAPVTAVKTPMADVIAPTTITATATSPRPVPEANSGLAPTPTELAAQQANQTVVQKPS